MAREGQTIAYSAAEAAAIQAVSDDRNAFHNALDQLGTLLDDDLLHGTTRHRAILEIELTMGQVVLAERELRHARLCRVWPALADVLTFIVHSEPMSTPQFLADTGEPAPVDNILRRPRSATVAPAADRESA